MKHEYRVEARPSITGHAALVDIQAIPLSDWLDIIAADGWRLVAVENGLYYFEREVAEIETK